MKPLQAARFYHAKGWSPIPIPHATKAPVLKNWSSLRFTEADLPAHFNGQPQNIGILLGEASNWLVDVDLDHPLCVAMAEQYLPRTPAIFGRAGKRRSHWIYKVSSAVESKRYRSKTAGMLLELRSSGLQTVFPPSTHVSEEAIEWEDGDSEPALIDPADLLDAVQQLADEAREQLGEAPAQQVISPFAESGVRITDASQRVAICVAAMLRMKVIDRTDGSSRLFAAACRAVEHDLSDQDAITAIRSYAQQRPFPIEWTDQQILDRIRDAELKATRGTANYRLRQATLLRDDDRTRVRIDPDEHRVVSQTIEALGQDQTIFHRGGALVRVIREHGAGDGVHRASGSAAITSLPPASLRERMTRFVQFTQLQNRGGTVQEVAAHPTQWLVGAVDSRGEWPGIRHLQGVSDVPVLRADGGLWQTPGYDAQSGVLYEPSDLFPPIPDQVTLDQAHAALTDLLEVVCDFRFESPDHRSAWLAGLLTPLGRFAFTGPSPFFLIDANVRGAGKGLLAQSIGQVVLGREMPVSSYAHDPDEMRKKITAIALAGDRLIHLDNLEGNFGNDALDRALTATRWKDRLLGKSQEVDLPLIPVWYGTGNNVAVAADTTRRIIHIRLDVLNERPEERTDFRHPQLIRWIQQNRARLLSSAMTLLRGYCDAGMPQQCMPAFGSFEGWSRLIRQAVVWLGLPDPCATRVKLSEQSDSTTDALARLIAAWQEVDAEQNGLVVSQLLSRLYAKEDPPRDPSAVAMRAAMENLVGCPSGRAPTPRQVGNKLKAYRRRVLNGAFLDSDPAEYNRHGAVWRLHHA